MCWREKQLVEKIMMFILINSHAMATTGNEATATGNQYGTHSDTMSALLHCECVFFLFPFVSICKPYRWLVSCDNKF